MTRASAQRWVWLCFAALSLAVLLLLLRESAAAVTLGFGHWLVLGPLSVGAGGLGVVAAFSALWSGRLQSGWFFRGVLLAFAALLMLLTVLVEFWVVDSRRVLVDGEQTRHSATLLAPRGNGPFPAALVLPSGAGADAREAYLLARYMAERGIVALATDQPLSDVSRGDAQALFARLVADHRVDEVRSGVVSVREQASSAIVEVKLASFLVVAGVRADPDAGHWGDIHVPVLLLIGGAAGLEAAEDTLEAVGRQLTAMTQAETDALVLADGDPSLRRSPFRFADGYPRIVPGWIHLIFSMPGELPDSQAI